MKGYSQHVNRQRPSPNLGSSLEINTTKMHNQTPRLPASRHTGCDVDTADVLKQLQNFESPPACLLGEQVEKVTEEKGVMAEF